MTVDVVVIGAGITGLTAAYELDAAGADVVLVERGDRFGGIVETIQDDGFLVEGGPDSFVTGKGSVLALAEKLGLTSQVISTRPESRGSYVWWDGRLHPLPGGLLLMVPARLGPFLRSSLLTWRGKARALADLILPRGQAGEDVAMGAFVRRRLGSEVLERLAEPLVAGIHGAEPDTMSLRSSFPRFLEMEGEHRSLILAARRLSAAPTPGGRSHFSSFRLGMGQLVASLAGALGRVDVRLGTAVSSVDRGAQGFTVRLTSGVTIDTRAVVLATPASEAGRLLAGVAPAASEVLNSIGQSPTTSVSMAFRSDDLPSLDGSGFVVPASQDIGIRGVSYLSRKWDGRTPDDGITLLRVFVQSDDDVVNQARQGLRTALGVDASPLRTWVHTHRAGLHRYTVGHPGRVAAVEQSLQSQPGLVVAGACLYGVGLNECVSSGTSAAASALEVLDSSELEARR